MIDGSARKVGQLRAWIGNRGFSILIWIADNAVSVRHIEIVADQGDAKGRVEMVQKHGSHLGYPVAIAVADQRDAIGILCFRAGEPLHPAGDNVLRAENRRLRTIALDHQYVPVGQHVERSWMLKSVSQCTDLQSLRNLRRFISPCDRFCDPYRWQQILLQRRQHGIGAYLLPWIEIGRASW